MSEAEFEALMAKRSSSCPLGGVAQGRAVKGEISQSAGKAKKANGPNKTEAEYGRHLELEFPWCKVTFEGLTIHMANGHRYTPDYVVQMDDGLFLMVEVKVRGKNGFRLPSYQRAKLAFDQCMTEWGCFRYRWAEKQSGKWYVTNY